MADGKDIQLRSQHCEIILAANIPTARTLNIGFALRKVATKLKDNPRLQMFWFQNCQNVLDAKNI
jgi:hypothetical protein